METWNTARQGLTTMRYAMVGIFGGGAMVFLEPMLGVFAAGVAVVFMLIGSLMFTFGMPSSEPKRLAVTAFFIGLLGTGVQVMGRQMHSSWDRGLNFLEVLGLCVGAVAMALHYGAWKKAANEFGNEVAASRSEWARILCVATYLLSGFFGSSARSYRYYDRPNAGLQLLLAAVGIAGVIAMWRAMTSLEETLGGGRSSYASDPAET